MMENTSSSKVLESLQGPSWEERQRRKILIQEDEDKMKEDCPQKLKEK
jgi:hypothetical protein